MSPLADGLFEFYSDQAQAMLAQYKSIEQLLGNTTHHTHTGSLCEELLRNTLRKHVLSWMSVDKGYVYGRIDHKKPMGHGPEIDILIHDTHRYRPLYRIGDFVIVQPESVIAMIQVKKTLDTSGENSLKKGIENISRAKQHLLDIYLQAQKRQFGDRQPSYPATDYALNHRIFTAVVAYEESLREETYITWLTEQYTKAKEWADPNPEFDTGVYILPSFIGSLTGTCLLSLWKNGLERRLYYVYDSGGSGKNVSLQLFLWNLTQFAFNWRDAKPPFSFTGMTLPPTTIEIPAAGKQWFHRSP